MGYGNEILRNIPEQFVTEETKYAVRIACLEFNSFSYITRETAMKLAKEASAVYTLTTWAYILDVTAWNALANIRKDTDRAIMGLMDGNIDMVDLSNLKDNIRSFYKKLEDLLERKITGY